MPRMHFFCSFFRAPSTQNIQKEVAQTSEMDAQCQTQAQRITFFVPQKDRTCATEESFQAAFRDIEEHAKEYVKDK